MYSEKEREQKLSHMIQKKLINQVNMNISRVIRDTALWIWTKRYILFRNWWQWHNYRLCYSTTPGLLRKGYFHIWGNYFENRLPTQLWTPVAFLKYVYFRWYKGLSPVGEKCNYFDKTFPVSDNNGTSCPQKYNLDLVHNCPDNKVEEKLSNKISENIVYSPESRSDDIKHRCQWLDRNGVWIDF